MKLCKRTAPPPNRVQVAGRPGAYRISRAPKQAPAILKITPPPIMKITFPYCQTRITNDSTRPLISTSQSKQTSAPVSPPFATTTAPASRTARARPLTGSTLSGQPDPLARPNTLGALAIQHPRGPLVAPDRSRAQISKAVHTIAHGNKCQSSACMHEGAPMPDEKRQP